MQTPPNARIPVLPSRNLVIFPGQSVPMLIGRTKSLAAVEEACKNEGWVILIAQRTEVDVPGVDDLYKVGTLSKLTRLKGDPKNGLQVLVTGHARFEVEELADGPEFLHASGRVLEDLQDLEEGTAKILMKHMKDLAKEMLSFLSGDLKKLAVFIDAVEDPILLSHTVVQHLDLELGQKQDLLQLISLKQRYLALLDLMVKQKEELKLQSEVNRKLSEKIGKQQREAILREQMKTIQEELGEGHSGSESAYGTKIENAKMPEAVKKIALEQWNRLKTLGESSPESHVIRNYLDLLCAMPWSKSSSDEIDLEFARETLRKDHYGLDKIKRRILQHLAVLKLKKDKKGSILLFVGPPGVGKTSLGKSIAAALGRKFVRASLGGVRDDAEIRGHRRTYIGAMPGRIVEGIKRAGVNNPVFMLDEIDKLSRGYSGDPASALLEVLDPEQNAAFTDHYLEVPFDLTNVFFIATANTLDSIPGPLLDRMETIHLSGYTIPEKLHIARNHLVPKQFEDHGLSSEQLELSEEVLLKTITSHSREAGVRELERKIAEIVRASAEKVLAVDAKLPIVVSIEVLEDILGPEKFFHEVAEFYTPPGVVTGLAWTPLGGEILFVEAKAMPGSGKLTLTGQLGDVMKESAQIGLSLVRSKLAGFAEPFDFSKNDVHIHVPAGAIPKDGPSAGVTMVTTLASLLLNRSVDPKLAMTGEVTLRGAVMPVGGIKEKMIAAHRAGIERVILAKKNERDLRDLPAEVQSGLKFEFAERVEDVLKIALGVEIPNATEQNQGSWAAAC
ncbi:MAG: endopeptidase La [Deltaproteobacteria bacterium]|nr:endopeptidase La [Deltaproteobacteria bacterium]